jgi:hypothetical protein
VTGQSLFQPFGQVSRASFDAIEPRIGLHIYLLAKAKGGRSTVALAAGVTRLAT